MKFIFLIVSLLSTLACHACDSCKGFKAPCYKHTDYYCDSCCYDSCQTLFIYDAKCKRFFFKQPGSQPQPLNSSNDFELRYKHPFQIKIINLNRYLYNVNLGNSDIAFTSTESPLLSQYGLPHGSDSIPHQAPTHTDASSANQGDNIFNLLFAFKPNIDRITGVIQNIVQLSNEVTVLNIETIKIKQRLDNLSSKRYAYSRTQQYVSRITKITDLLKHTSDTLKYQVQHFKTAPAIEAIGTYYNDVLPNARVNLDNSQKVLDNVTSELTSDKKGSKQELKELNVLQMNIKKIKDSISILKEKVTEDSVKLFICNAITRNGLILTSRFHDLEKYYTNFVDNKIKAYSLCTTDFDCCNKEDTNNFTHFNELLTKISEAYALFRDTVNLKQKIKKQDAAPSSSPAPRKDIFLVSSSDLTFKNGKLTELSIHQDKDTKPATPQKPDTKQDDNIASLDSLENLWYLFEKSVSPDFIMRQILFKRNMVHENMSYTSPPIYPYGDRMGIVFQIVASDSARKNGVILDQTTVESLDFIVRGRPLFSFSAGTFFGFFSNIKSPTYEFRQVPAAGSNLVQSNSPYQLRQTGNGSLPVGLDAMANISGYISPSLRVGLSAGIGATLAPDFRLGYLAGLTFSAGSYQQFHFSTGALMMNINELKADYKNNNNLYSTIPSGNVYNQVMKTGMFFSLSYTVFRIKNTGNIQNGMISLPGRN